MKKYLALILAIVMSLSLVACGGGGGGTESPSGGGETQSGGQTASGGDIYVLVPNADHGWTGAVLTYAQQKAEEVNAEGNYVTDDFIAYCLPLIQGETPMVKEDGLPRFCNLKKVFAK